MGSIRRIAYAMGFWIVGLLAATPAHAGVWLQGAAAFLQLQDDAGAASVSASRFLLSTTGGYRFKQGFVIGAQVLSVRDTGATDRSVLAWGPKGGLFLKGFELTAAFLPWADQTLGGVERSGGGFAVNLGYNWALTGFLEIGVYATYWSVTFTEEGSSSLADKPQMTAIAPQVSVGIHL